MSHEIVQVVGYEWRKPASAHDVPQGVAVKTLNDGVLMLYRRERYESADAGGFRWVMVRPSELKTGDED